MKISCDMAIDLIPLYKEGAAMTADALLKNTLPDVRSARGYSEATLAIHREYVREATLNRQKALSENIPTSRTLSTEST